MHAKISHRSAPVMKSILVPVDFSAVTSRVVDSAIKLARMAKARVVLLHVVPSPSVIRNVLPAVEDVRMRQASTGHQAEKKLIELKRAFRRKCSNIELVHLTGSAASRIVAHAQTIGATHIVLGSHGHSALRDALVGSVASSVIKTAPCPVLVIPALNAAAKSS